MASVQKSRKRSHSSRFYITSAKSSMNPTLGEALKRCAMRLYQLKIGHGAVGTFLAGIGAMETPECWWCGNTRVNGYPSLFGMSEMEERAKKTK